MFCFCLLKNSVLLKCEMDNFTSWKWLWQQRFRIFDVINLTLITSKVNKQFFNLPKIVNFSFQGFLWWCIYILVRKFQNHDFTRELWRVGKTRSGRKIWVPSYDAGKVSFIAFFWKLDNLTRFLWWPRKIRENLFFPNCAQTTADFRPKFAQKSKQNLFFNSNVSFSRLFFMKKC